MKRFLFSVALVFLFGLNFSLLPTAAHGVLLDLNNFYLEGDGSIAPDGSSATLEIQDPYYGYTLLVNDPLWGDPGIVVDPNPVSLSFGFEFFEQTGNDTEFYVRLFDGSNGDFIDELLVNESSTSIHTFDLTSLAINQTLLGMDFTITEYSIGVNNDYNLGSWVIIDYLDLVVQETPIPEPGTFILLSAGLIALAGGMRRKRQR